MRIWRLARQAYCRDRAGEGARLNGGRWNAVGTGVLYGAASISLASLEYLSHLGIDCPVDLVLVGIDVPDNAPIFRPAVQELPEDWRSPFPSPTCQAWGTAWCHQGKELLMEVPSVIVPEESNFVINSAHLLMAGVTLSPIRAFNFDLRVVKR